MKRIQYEVYEFIINSGIEKLPLDFNTIVHIIVENGWQIYSYSEAAEYFESMREAGNDLSTYINERSGFTVFHNGEVYIFFNDELEYHERIFVLCHEIGHIVLKHAFNGILGKGDSSTVTKVQEKEADKFALELNAPTPFLKQLNVKSYKEICCLGFLSEDRAKQQFVEYTDAKDKSSYYLENDDEKKICEIFHYQIKRQKKQIQKRKIKKALIVCSLVALVSAISIFMYSYISNNFVNHIPDASRTEPIINYTSSDANNSDITASEKQPVILPDETSSTALASITATPNTYIR